MTSKAITITCAPDLKGFVDDDILELTRNSPMLASDLIMLMNIRVNKELLEVFKDALDEVK